MGGPSNSKQFREVENDMTTNSAAHLSIETRLRNQWADQNVELRYENEARKIPIGEHVRLHVRSFRAIETGYSGGKVLYRRPGMIVAQCFVEAKTGTQRARVIADAVIDIYEGQEFEGITCNESEVVEVGDDGNGFWQVNAKIYFDHDYERTY